MRISSCSEDDETDSEMTNYSGTHSITPKKIFTPTSIDELKEIVAKAHADGQSIRPVGRFLSPNGIASCADGMLSLSDCDKIVRIDKEKMLVTVEGGALVQTVLEALAKEGLTLSNFSSIKEQQMAGWTSVSAHGTGARLPTVDEMITEMKLITPASGELVLSAESESEHDRRLFSYAKVGLGALGIISEMTLSCIPAHFLHETTRVVTDMDLLRHSHGGILQENRHTRYMWLPYTGACVVVTSNPIGEEDAVAKMRNIACESGEPETPDPLAQMKKLYAAREGVPPSGGSCASIRDELIDLDPLSVEHISQVNQAEFHYWQSAPSERVAKSDEILGFDCGGQQWVLEVCFPAGTVDEPNGRDIDFVLELQQAILDQGLPAPAPIEQRWTARSTSPMSPAFSADPSAFFSWVGIIMYLPPGQDEKGREAITSKFKEYAALRQAHRAQVRCKGSLGEAGNHGE